MNQNEFQIQLQIKCKSKLNAIFFCISTIGLGLQGLQNLQNLQNLPNLAGNPQLNTIDMLNLMQFQHLLSLNFMNLAPPLIFGAAAAAQQANTNNDAGLNIAPNLGRSTASMSSVSSNASDIAVNANPIAAAQKVQLLQQQAAAVQQVQFDTFRLYFETFSSFHLHFQ